MESNTVFDPISLASYGDREFEDCRDCDDIYRSVIMMLSSWWYMKTTQPLYLILIQLSWKWWCSMRRTWYVVLQIIHCVIASGFRLVRLHSFRHSRCTYFDEPEHWHGEIRLFISISSCKQIRQIGVSHISDIPISSSATFANELIVSTAILWLWQLDYFVYPKKLLYGI